MTSVALVDYGVGNIGNLKYAFEKMGYQVQLTASAQAILNADVAVLPGVGAFGDAMVQLKSKGLDQVLLKRAALNKRVLGICLGMQLLCEGSEEHDTQEKGLGWFKGTLTKFDQNLRVPHMGWNTLVFTSEPQSPSTAQPYVYFVHSYKLSHYDPNQMVAFSDYGGCVPAIVKKGSVTGFQFHPEKSGEEGLALLKAYMLEQ